MSNKLVCENCNGKGYLIVDKMIAMRDAKGLTQAKAATALGYSRTSLSNIERGIQSPPIETIMNMATLYEVEPTEIFEALVEVNKSEIYRKPAPTQAIQQKGNKS